VTFVFWLFSNEKKACGSQSRSRSHADEWRGGKNFTFRLHLTLKKISCVLKTEKIRGF
jgi:hypothetical protein